VNSLIKAGLEEIQFKKLADVGASLQIVHWAIEGKDHNSPHILLLQQIPVEAGADDRFGGTPANNKKGQKGDGSIEWGPF